MWDLHTDTLYFIVWMLPHSFPSLLCCPGSLQLCLSGPQLGLISIFSGIKALSPFPALWGSRVLGGSVVSVGVDVGVGVTIAMVKMEIDFL